MAVVGTGAVWGGRDGWVWLSPPGSNWRSGKDSGKVTYRRFLVLRGTGLRVASRHGLGQSRPCTAGGDPPRTSWGHRASGRVLFKKKRRFVSLVELGPLRVCENVHLQDPFVEKGGGAVPAT